MALIPLRRAGALCLALAGLLLPGLAQAAVPALTLVHSFSFSRDAHSAQGAVATLSGDVQVRDGVLAVQGDKAFAEYAGLIPSAENGADTWWTVSLWARQTPGTGTTTEAVMVGQGVVSGYLPEFALSLRPVQGGGREVVGLNQSGWGGGRSAPVAHADQWHHYTVAMAENNVLLWVDGQYLGHGGAGWNYSTPYFHGNLRLGRQVSGFGGQFNGELDDVRIYSGRIDDATVRAQFLAGPSVSAVPEPAPALMALAGGALLWARRRRGA
ncbi:LamG domain-containing protein [Aquabacterium sp. OR-4]|uniref:LamG domain-containing protein n=1 Tax=Aquabacterium sp. OR-4 TaxID=2978127 RepID=UPI0021B4CFC7|nr:LamG domain-containing protein [Aquabacterium sp. OR-4]MDT7833762.1 LamG domain-containing protein [Aquabacterium sp. OR-4]